MPFVVVDVAGSDLMAELEHCKGEKSVLELKLAQYRLDQLQKSMPAKLSYSSVSVTRKPKASGVDAMYDIAGDQSLKSNHWIPYSFVEFNHAWVEMWQLPFSL